MKFTPYASGSSGNVAELTDGETNLLLDAGLPLKQIQKALKYRLSRIDGVLISHSHGDHTAGVKGLLEYGIDVYMSRDTKQELNLDHHRLHVFERYRRFMVGTMKIMPFELQHDVSNTGFLIQDQTGFNTLYAVDTYYIKHRFSGLGILAIEANYSEELLDENIRDGVVPYMMKKRLLESHFSLENVIEFLRANDLSQVQEIWLLHLSDNNSDEAYFKKVVRGQTGLPCYIA